MYRFLSILLSVQVAIVCSFSIKPHNNRRVCVIGAGIAGLSTARYLKEEGLNFTVLEATKYIGGTWRFDPRVGSDEYGVPIFTSMYKDLRTNLPKPTMELRGFPIPENFPSFPPWYQYYDYIKAYAEYFDLHRHIQFLSLVIKVTRVGDEWSVRHRDVSSGEEFETRYDYIIIGSGHHYKPKMPSFPGENIFKGTIIHSHTYKEKTPYKNRRVLVVGAGPSGMDINLVVAEIAAVLVHSHHSKINFKTKFPPNYIRKPDIREYNQTGVIFIDGSYEDIDDVIYCTGFEYYYPFLDGTSQLTVAPRSVTPLHQQMVNIHQPSMMILGLLARACLVVAIDAQARYATALVKGNFELPPKEEMLAQWQEKVDRVMARKLPLSQLFYLGDKEDIYYEDLTQESGIERVPPVIYRIRAIDTLSKLDNLYTYRNYEYTVIDRETFTRRLRNDTALLK